MVKAEEVKHQPERALGGSSGPGIAPRPLPGAPESAADRSARPAAATPRPRVSGRGSAQRQRPGSLQGHHAWPTELGYGELKTRLRGPEVILRSRSPRLVEQEIFAFLVVYQALCSLRGCAARAADADPDRISFTVTLRLAREQACNQAAATPTGLREAVEQTITDLLDELLPPRRPRSYMRKKRPVKNAFPSGSSASLAHRARSPTSSRSPATTPTWANVLSNRHCR